MRLRYHQLVGMTVYDVDGVKVGRVADLATERRGDELCVVGLYAGPAALLRRVGAHRDSILAEQPAEQISWELIASIDDGIRLRISREQLRRLAPGVEEPDRVVRPGGEG